MLIRYGCEFTFEVPNPTSAVYMVDIHPDRRRDILAEHPTHRDSASSPTAELDAFGNRIRRYMAPAGLSTMRLSGVIRDSGNADATPIGVLATPVQNLPADILVFLNGSRYCDTDLFGEIAWTQFGSMAAGAAMVRAICDYVHQHITFGYQHARATRTASEAYRERVGVCRDYTHLAITLCRCMNVPARYVNGYLGDIGVPVDPAAMDFNAWFEAYLDGSWYTFDARHNQPRIGRLTIARGRDATDVPILQTFGPHTLLSFGVVTEEIADATLPIAVQATAA
jgi:transglutaminase-like putative cysteine protease